MLICVIHSLFLSDKYTTTHHIHITILPVLHPVLHRDRATFIRGLVGWFIKCVKKGLCLLQWITLESVNKIIFYSTHLNTNNKLAMDGQKEEFNSAATIINQSIIYYCIEGGCGMHHRLFMGLGLTRNTVMSPSGRVGISI